MKSYNLLRVVCRLILPFIILFGIYMILNGDLSPGGGFQGGVVLATGFLVIYFINEEKPLTFERMIQIEKTLFVLLIVSSVLMITQFQFAKSILGVQMQQGLMKGSLAFFNCVIGAKVTVGLCGIMLIFIEEGRI